MSSSHNNKRIVKNSLFLYIRMILLMGISFFTVRIILEALGVEDLGIYNVVGSLIAIFDFVSSGLTNASQRFINIGLGKNDIDLTRQYFSQSLVIHVALALFVALLAETIGLWFVYNKLVIPSDRFQAAIFIYHISVIALVLRLIKICFESDIIAREKMSVYAYLSIFEGIAKLLICYAVIAETKFDKLVFYGSMLLLVNFLITAFNVVYCLAKYPETHFHIYNDRKVYRNLLSFVGQNSFGVIAWAIGKQGLNVVLNLFCGPVVNGAKGIASNLDRVVSQFGSNIDISVRPQITKLYAQNRQVEMVSMAMKSTKYIYFMELLVSVPFLFQTENILAIWLKEVPEYTCMFVQLLVLETLFSVLGSGFNTLSLALGKLKSTQVYGRFITLAILPLSYVILKLNPNPFYPMLISVTASLAYSIYLVYIANKYLSFGWGMYLKKIANPVVLVTALVMIGCFFFNDIVPIEGKWASAIFYSLLLCSYSAIVIILLGLEKADVNRALKFMKKKFRGGGCV